MNQALNQSGIYASAAGSVDTIPSNKDMQNMTNNRTSSSLLSETTQQTLQTRPNSVSRSPGDSLPLETIVAAVDAYFLYNHDQPYSFFHAAIFKRNLLEQRIPDHLLFAILANAVRFCADPYFQDQPNAHAEKFANRAWNAIVSQIFIGGVAPNLATVQSITLLSIFDYTGIITTVTQYADKDLTDLLPQPVEQDTAQLG